MKKPSHRTFALANEYHRRGIAPEIMPSGKPRVRCARCNKHLFNPEVAYDGKYCLLTCADPDRALTILRAVVIYDAWRAYAYCWKCRTGSGSTKRVYHSPQAAGKAAASITRHQDKPATFYSCPRGKGWHVTTKITTKEK
jgi:hypothetical protein